MTDYLTELPGLAEACQKVQKPESRTVQTLDQLDALVQRLSEVDVYAVDTETTSLSIPRLSLVGISFAFSETEAWYVPTGHISLEKQIDAQTVIEAIRPAMEDPKKQALLHHAKYDIAVLQKYGIHLPMNVSLDFQNINDSMIAAWILDENQPKSLKFLARKNFDMQMTQFKKLGSTTVTTEEGGNFYENDVLGVIAEEDDFTDISAISVQTAAAYAKDDAIATYKLNHLFKQQLIEENLYKQYLNELRLTPVMVHISFNGVLLDVAKVKEKHRAAVEEVTRLEAKIKGLMLQNPKTAARVDARRSKLTKKAQESATLDSLLTLKSPQLKNQILYQDLGLADDRTIITKSGNYSTAKWALKALVRKGQREDASENERIGGEIAESLLKFSQKTKLIDAFFKPLTEKAVDGKIYTQFNNVGTATGRFSAQNPNLMQMPRDTKEERFREIFVAPHGYKWVSVDLSQIELRLGAHYSSDPAMLDAYAKDEDIHTRTAIQMSGKNPEDFEGGVEGKEWKTIRTLGKVLNFGVFYGMSGDKLYDTLVNEFGMPEDSISPEECNKKIEAFFIGYGGVKAFIQRQHLLVEQDKYVKTILGRKRRLPHANKPARLTASQRRDPVLYEVWRRYNSLYHSALRISVNTVIQGCLVGTMRILTEQNGYAEIGSLSGKNVSVWDGSRFSKATVLPSGKKQIVRLTLFDGNTIECSPEHRFLVINTRGSRSWKRPEEIRNQERIVLGEEIPSWSAPLDIPPIIRGKAHNSSNYSTENITEKVDLGRWLGRIASDGSVCRNKAVHLLVAEHEKSMLPYLEEVCSQVGNWRYGNVRPGKGIEPLHRIDIASKSLANQLAAMGVKHRIPECAWKDKDVLRGYLSGLFDGDGTASGDTITLTFGKIHTKIKWAREVQQALLLFGIRSRVTPCADRVNVSLYKRDTPLFCDRIGFINPKKQSLAEQMKVSPGHRFNNGTIYGRAVRIKDVCVSNEWVEMYDVVNSETEQFMTGGVITHNSAADLIKIMMVKTFNEVIQSGIYDVGNRRVQLLLQVHDELNFYAPEETADAVMAHVKKIMTDVGVACKLRVPIKGEGSTGKSWSESK